VTYSALALDQSMRHTGYAHIASDGEPISFGTFSLPFWGDSEGKYLWRWFRWLEKMCEGLKVTHLFVEQTFVPPGHDEGLTLKLAQYGLIANACMVAHTLTERGQHIDMQMVSTSQWRPPFLGAEKPPHGFVGQQRRSWLKDRAKAACEARGWAVMDDNQADACGILCFGVSTVDVNFMVRQGPLFRRSEMEVDREKREL
jgi:hypothetical protein